jgi:hypothetical protein
MTFVSGIDQTKLKGVFKNLVFVSPFIVILKSKDFRIKLVSKLVLTFICKWMLTRSKSKQGEGKLASYNIQIGSRSFTRRGKMDSPRKLGPYDFEDDFFEAFLMKAMVEEMYKDRKKTKGESTSVKTKAVKEETEGEEPPEPPSSPSSSSFIFRWKWTFFS